jgi:hypothetical protein
VNRENGARWPLHNSVAPANLPSRTKKPTGELE